MVFMSSFMDGFLPLMIFSIPMVAIVGGITAGIVKTITDSRIIENAQRERLAAIERGLDPTKLPPLPQTGMGNASEIAGDPRAGARHMSNGLLIWGLVALMGGVGLMAFLFIESGGDRDWAVGLIPGFIGLALLLSGVLVRPRSN